MGKRIVLCLGGGVMTGVFGAGIVTGLQEANAYDKIKEIYAGSAGAFNAAYFLARQSELGSSAYWEDLPGKLISLWGLLKGRQDAINIDYLMDVVRHKKKLDVKKIQSQRIPFNVKVLNNETGEVGYIDGKKRVFAALKAAVNAFPFYKVDGEKYIDGDIRDPLGLDYVLKRHRRERIVLAVNYKPKFTLFNALKDYYSGIVAGRRRKDLPFRKYFWERRRLFMEGMEKAGKNGRVLVVCPPAQSKTGTLTGNGYKLRETWLFGKKEAENKILPFLAEGSLKRDGQGLSKI